MLGGKERLEPFLVQTEEADVYSGRKVGIGIRHA